MPAGRLLARLEGVRELRGDQYSARCPAHEDRRASLSIKEVGGGRVLIHCFAGCGALDVLEAVGLTWADVMPERPKEHRYKPQRYPFDVRQVIPALSEELTILSLLVGDLACQTCNFGFNALADRLTLGASRLARAAGLGERMLAEAPELRAIRRGGS